MTRPNAKSFGSIFLTILGVCAFQFGCQTTQVCIAPPADNLLPRELRKVSLPPYVIEPPDILVIDAISVVPKPPYRISPMDSLLIQATVPAEAEPIGGMYAVEPEGTVNLGSTYGTVNVADLTLEEARVEMEKHLKLIVKTAKVTVSLGHSRGLQQIRGEHLVGMDGTISLGVYGSVPVAGLTVPEAKAAVEEFLTKYLKKPEISMIVTGYNSKVYYVVLDGGGYGQQMYRLPVTGNETVMDALAQINGLPGNASVKDVWVARPAPDDLGCDQVIPVDLVGISKCGRTGTNYQILPGDRIYVKADKLITIDNTLAKVFAPVERVLGITLLGSSTQLSIRSKPNNGSGGGGGF